MPGEEHAEAVLHADDIDWHHGEYPYVECPFCETEIRLGTHGECVPCGASYDIEVTFRE